MSNENIKNYAKRHGVALWEIGARLGVHENTFYRKLRYSLSEEEQAEIRAIIDDISTRGTANG